MNKKELPIVIMSAGIALILSIILGNLLLSHSIKGQTIQVVPTLNDSFSSLNNQAYNNNIRDFTVFIKTGQPTTNQPFNN